MSSSGKLRTGSSGQGFTLLEVMVALAILAIAITALFGSQSRSLSLAIEGKFYGMASLLAQEKLAEYTAGVEELVDREGDFGEHFPGVSWKAEVRDAQLEFLSQLPDLDRAVKRLDLTISWDNEQFSSTFTEYFRSKGQQ